MIIKATRLQAWAPAGGGGKSRPSPPPPLKKIFWGYIGVLFATFSSYGGLFATFFSFWVPFGYFLFHGVGLFFGHLRKSTKSTKISAGAHDCKEGSRACFPENFLGDRNLVSSGHVLLRFCLKNEKNNDYYSTFIQRSIHKLTMRYLHDILLNILINTYSKIKV